MKKLLVLLMSLILIFNLTAMSFAATLSVPGTVTDDVEEVIEPDAADEPQAPSESEQKPAEQKPAEQKPAEQKPAETPVVEEKQVEIAVQKTTVGDVELKAEEVKVETVTAESLAKEQPIVAAAIEDTKAAVAEVNSVITSEKATVEEKKAAVTTYFEAKGSAVSTAITKAVEASKEVASLADITPVVVAPIKVDMTGDAKTAVEKAIAAGETFQMTIDVPEEFKGYELGADSFLCAELVDENGEVHIVTFKVVDGKLVGDFPKMGVISNFWVGSVNAPKTGNTNLDGVIVCGMLLCAAALLFSVKRIKVQE